LLLVWNPGAAAGSCRIAAARHDRRESSPSFNGKFMRGRVTRGRAVVPWQQFRLEARTGVVDAAAQHEHVRPPGAAGQAL